MIPNPRSMKTNILFVGRFYPKGILDTIVADTRGAVGFSNHNFEKSLIEGFSRAEDVELRVVTAPMVFSYPHNNRRPFIRKEHYLEGNHTVRSIGFCNVAALNILSERMALTKAIRKELKAFAGEEVTVVVNTPSLILSSALFKAMERVDDKNIRTLLIVPDIPECMVEMDGRMSMKNRLVSVMNRRTREYSLRYDKYVYLTGAMDDFYHAGPGRSMVMEGLVDDRRVATEKATGATKPAAKEIILYTGTLRRIFGVTFLADVFEKGCFPDTELWICGSGEAAEELAERARRNPNIKFFGLVDSERALALQRQATILANPRPSEGNYTRYSFPSKTLEYLLAGKTVVMNRLPGIPAEYDGYLHYPSDESREAWIAKIREIMSMRAEDRSQRDKAGRAFIIGNKTASRQCRRIVDFINRH